MILSLWHSVGALLVSLMMTSLFEVLLHPRPRPLWQRSTAAISVHVATAALHFLVWLLIVQRPWFAMVITASLQMVVVQVNNTKWTSLREPFLCQDFEYFIDAVRHPRLYIPFFGIGLTIIASSAGAIAIALGFWLESSVYGRPGAPWTLCWTLAVTSVAIVILYLQLKRLPSCTLEPQEDLERIGLIPYLWSYGLLTLRPLAPSEEGDHFPPPDARPEGESQPDSERLPHLVMVQSESFFDPREWHSAIRPEILEVFDTLGDQAVQAGRLDVPAWGANTVRTECAVLTGLTPIDLGAHRFNPYHQLAKREVPNLAGALKALGYRTICIHPYPASFYLRDRVYARLGFDQFIDIAEFSTSDRDGQYVGDLALAERAQAILDQADEKPLFIFIISMENHGPLHLEAPDPAVAKRWLDRDVTGDDHELTVYLRHLRNTDSMLARLRDSLGKSERQGMLAFYGDHVPIMPKVYAHHGEPNGLTDYFIWQTGPSSGGVRTTLPADKLGTTIYNRIIGRA